MFTPQEKEEIRQIVREILTEEAGTIAQQAQREVACLREDLGDWLKRYSKTTRLLFKLENRLNGDLDA